MIESICHWQPPAAYMHILFDLTDPTNRALFYFLFLSIFPLLLYSHGCSSLTGPPHLLLLSRLCLPFRAPFCRCLDERHSHCSRPLIIFGTVFRCKVSFSWLDRDDLIGPCHPPFEKHGLPTGEGEIRRWEGYLDHCGRPELCVFVCWCHLRSSRKTFRSTRR